MRAVRYSKPEEPSGRAASEDLSECHVDSCRVVPLDERRDLPFLQASHVALPVRGDDQRDPAFGGEGPHEAPQPAHGPPVPHLRLELEDDCIERFVGGGLERIVPVGRKENPMSLVPEMLDKRGGERLVCVDDEQNAHGPPSLLPVTI